MGDVKLRFVARYAKFENWDEGYDTVQSAIGGAPVKMESRMNSDTTPPQEPEGGFRFSGPSPMSPMPDNMMPPSGEPDIPF